MTVFSGHTNNLSRDRQPGGIADMNERHEANRRHWNTRAVEWAQRPEAEKVWFQWTMGDYINAVLAAGCEIEGVEEFGTGSDGAWEVPPVGRLPRVLLVVGRRS